MANEDFTTYTETDPNSHISKTSSKVTWTGLSNDEDAYVYKDKDVDHFNGDFVHQFEIEFSGVSGTPIGVHWAVANLVNDREAIRLGGNMIGFSWEYTAAHGYGFHLFCLDGEIVGYDWDGWDAESPSTKYYITIQHDWDGGVNSTGRTTAWIRTGSQSGVLQATLIVDRGEDAAATFRYIYACQSCDKEMSTGINGFTENLNLSASVPPVYKELAGTCAISSTVTGAIKSIRGLAGTIAITTTTAGVLQRRRSISRTTTIQSTGTGELTKRIIKELAGVVAISSTTTGEIKRSRGFAGVVVIESASIGGLTKTGFKELAGVVVIESATSGTLKCLRKFAGVVVISSTVIGELAAPGYKELAGVVAIKSTVTGMLITPYDEIPPLMEKELIDPYASGAWLWLVQIAVPGQATQRIARNTEDVHYDGEDYEKFNIQIGEQIFSGDGSIPRVTLKIFQDVNRKVENIVNATEGALGAAVKLIRVNEKWLDSPVAALEADYDNLASQSDNEWLTFTLGIPNPLIQRFPLRDYSSSICPWATPALFKGPECQYADEDATCTGTYDDCYTNKDNAEHWGGELGLSPSITRLK